MAIRPDRRRRQMVDCLDSHFRKQLTPNEYYIRMGGWPDKRGTVYFWASVYFTVAI